MKTELEIKTNCLDKYEESAIWTQTEFVDFVIEQCQLYYELKTKSSKPICPKCKGIVKVDSKGYYCTKCLDFEMIV